MPPHICNFIKQVDHQPCAVMVHDGADTACCGTHRPIAARLPPRVAGQCEHIVGTGMMQHWCARAGVPGDRLCAIHVDRRAREADAFRRQAEAHIAAVEADRPNARARAEAARAELWARIRAEAARAELWARIDAQHARGGGYYGDGRPQPAPAFIAGVAPPPGLQRLALDTQNVHTAAVAKQTTEGEAKLLAVKGDGHQVGLRVLRVFAARAGSLQQVMRVMNDIDHWYNQQNCRTMGDRLYGKVLEGLWHTIQAQPEPARVELIQRLWEEASESVGMCCEGHISRLVNVMVGFDSAFAPPVSRGEILQNKMAALAAMSVEADVRVAYARAFMNELGMPEGDQAPWLEALA